MVRRNIKSLVNIKKLDSSTFFFYSQRNPLCGRGSFGWSWDIRRNGSCRSLIAQMEFPCDSFSHTEGFESNYIFFWNVPVSFFAIVRSQIREGNLTAYPHRIGDTRIEISVKFLIFCLKVIIDLEVDKERCFESFFKNTSKEMFGHIKGLSVDTDQEFGIWSLDVYKINPLLLILALRSQILDSDTHECEKLSGDIYDFCLHENTF